MQTLRLRKLVDPRQAQVLLEAYVAHLALLPAGATMQRDLARLPLAFQDRAEQAEANGLVWCAWTSGSQAWLFVGHLNLSRSRERGQPILEIDAYDFERRTKSRAVALRKPDGAWDRLNE